MSKTIKPLTLVAILVLAVATALNWMSVWGVLYLYWAGAGALSGSAFIVESVTRADNSALFWLINAMWAVIGLWTVVNAL